MTIIKTTTIAKLNNKNLIFAHATCSSNALGINIPQRNRLTAVLAYTLTHAVCKRIVKRFFGLK